MKDELEVMSKIKMLLEPLDAAARARALAWVASALDIVGGLPVPVTQRSNLVTTGQPELNFGTFAEFFSRR